MIQVLMAAGMTAALSGFMSTSHEHDHDHGKANMVIVLEEEALSVTFEAHQADLAGFETAPRSAEEIHILEELPARLSAAEKLFALTASASCEFSGMEVSGLPGADGHEEPHDKGEDHEDDHHEAHLVISATYHWSCRSPRKLKEVETLLFEEFPAIARINAIAFLNGQQTADILLPQRPRIKFK
ncbi:ZrgA family zinc uptake protein [Parvularcula marina]|nr:DUF2796 domain-containing protein [Parvularcula marina]